MSQLWSANAGELESPSLETWRATTGLALAQGIAGTREGAQALRPEFKAWVDASLIAKDPEALIDPQNFRAWQLGRHGGAQNADIAVCNGLGRYTGVDGRRQSYDVPPIVAGDVVQWIDPAGFAVARSVRSDVLLKGCNLPLTGKRVADLVITDLGVFTLARHGEPKMALIELADGVPLEEIKTETACYFEINLRE
ncbi:hypothetical protein [Rhizobium leguminosarum]|uniref:hypothetical protein n=1 Tax=Rhizobium leguminosarum TaxID=384 RepID=UPI00197DABF4|nr:hypothetical protein [Rhizobium leguminosarum]